MSLAGVLVLAALAKPATISTPAGPVRIDADEVHYAFQAHEVLFTGAPVTLYRDDATLTCLKLVAMTDISGEVEKATCTGEVKFVRAARVVTCDKATYLAAENRVICDGNAVVREKASEGHGTRLVYDLTTDDVRLTGEPGKPVKILVPKEEVDRRQRLNEERRKEGQK